MPYVVFFILILVIIALTYFLIRKWNTHEIYPLDKINQIRENQKEDAKDKIMVLFKNQDTVHNKDVENLLSVSDATATNYLEELEKESKITQYGHIGRGVFYRSVRFEQNQLSD